ncbi:MAG: FAD-dependent oxidoreductase, partial [Planctomycetes bacterium]|nr:FAD-dependent oxidoreductase [Planctomycetota bacterium]
MSAVLLLLSCSQLLSAPTVRQSARQLPVAREVDVVVVGGSVGAVAAAVEAGGQEATVLLVAPRTYLGDDMCARLRLWLEEGETPQGDLTKELFQGRPTTTPMRVKTVLEAALLRAGVDFLLGSYATDVFFDSGGEPAGIAIANRAGRQAIVAKVIIDATERASIAKAAGAEHGPWVAGKHVCRRVVLGGEPTGDAPPVRRIPAGETVSGSELDYHEYRLELDLGDGSFSAMAEAEQHARDLTYRDGQLRAAERITFIPPDSIRGRRSAADWQALEPWAIDHFRPRGVDRVYVLSVSADVPRAVAETLLRPDVAESLGRVVGKEAARVARSVGRPSGVRWPEVTGPPAAGSLSENLVTGWKPVLRRGSWRGSEGDVREILSGLRPTHRAERTVDGAEQRVPVLAEVDLLVVGGGTTGACAAIAAARRGINVLVVEYQEGLGGVGTMGLIGRAYHGQNLGFTKEVPFCDQEHNTEYKMEWFRREIRAAGGQIWFGTLGCGALVEGNLVKGALVATPLGRGVVLADVVIDATGSGDVAVAAGAQAMYGADKNDIALQGTGLPMRPLGKTYVNTDYLLVDESDLIDTWRALVGVRLAADADVYDVGTFIQTRERRRVLGDHVLSYLDQIAGRTYPDSVVLSGSDYDSHGYPSEPFFALIPHTKKTLKANHPAPGGTCYTPYRCLLPRGLEGIVVTGLAISMQRDASAMVRMQKDMHNQGYAAGMAASMAVKAGCVPREIDVDALQEHLVDVGNLPASVLEDEDSFPLPQKRLAAAVRQLTDERQTRKTVCRALAIVLSHPEQARAPLRAAFASAEGPSRLTYAKV